jgi:uncharacterized integral membrane protein (TIGR00698 family)
MVFASFGERGSACSCVSSCVAFVQVLGSESEESKNDGTWNVSSDDFEIAIAKAMSLGLLRIILYLIRQLENRPVWECSRRGRARVNEKFKTPTHKDPFCTMMMFRRSASVSTRILSRRSQPSSFAWSNSLRHFSASSKDEEQDSKPTKATTNNGVPVKPPPPTKPSASTPSILPGIGLSAVTALGGFQIASGLSSALAVPISGIPVAILLGMAVNNGTGYGSADPVFKSGITFATKTVLQTGIVCVAAKLSFLELLTTGSTGIPVVLASVGAGMLFIPAAGRFAGLPHQMTLLLTAGTSICGVTAITALAPAIHAPNRDIAVAVANTVAFGTVGMIAYPYLFHYLCSSSEAVGLCLGVAIHDTSQVLGAALSYKETFGDEVAFKVAAVTKLMRNLGLAVAIPALTYSYQKEKEREQQQQQQQQQQQELISTTAATTNDETASATTDNTNTVIQTETISGLATFQKYIPPFLVAFLGMSALRSGGDLMFADVEAYTQAVNLIGNDLSKYALGTAMAGVGLSTSASSLKGVGWKPFAVGGAGALVVGGTGFTVATFLV